MSEFGWLDETLMDSIWINGNKKQILHSYAIFVFHSPYSPFISLCAFRQKTADWVKQIIQIPVKK